MIQAIIIDDEPLARLGLRDLLRQHADVHVAAEADSPHTALPLIRELKPQVLFLDIEMGRDSGFDLLANLDCTPRVIFITAHSQHAVKAFEIPAFDYLLKPVRPERLQQTMERLRIDLSGEGDAAAKVLHLKSPGRSLSARHDDILILIADGDFTLIHLANEPPFMICHTLGHFESILPSPPFHRIDRSTLINLHNIERVERQSRSAATITFRSTKENFAIGRTALTRLTRLMN